MARVHIRWEVKVKPGDTIQGGLQSQKAVTAYLKSKQLLTFGFARQSKSPMVMI